jgi:hypothetical protein
MMSHNRVSFEGEKAEEGMMFSGETSRCAVGAIGGAVRSNSAMTMHAATAEAVASAKIQRVRRVLCGAGMPASSLASSDAGIAGGGRLRSRLSRVSSDIVMCVLIRQELAKFSQRLARSPADRCGVLAEHFCGFGKRQAVQVMQDQDVALGCIELIQPFLQRAGLFIEKQPVDSRSRRHMRG